MLQFGRRGRFDAAIAHGSTDLPMACRVLRVPNTTMFDYEFATAPAQRSTAGWRTGC